MYFLTLLYVITSPLALNHCTYILVGFLFQVQVLSSLFSDEEFSILHLVRQDSTKSHGTDEQN